MLRCGQRQCLHEAVFPSWRRSRVKEACSLSKHICHDTAPSRRVSMLHVPTGVAAAQTLLSSSARSPSLFRSSGVLLYRNVVENTLADTPSGYIQDPRAHPKEMVTYNKLSRESAAALEALEAERELMEKEELAYKGYTTLEIQKAKSVIMNPFTTTEEEIKKAVATLQAELAEKLIPAVGTEVDKPPSKEKVLMLKWQQRQRRLADRNRAFRAPSTAKPDFHLHLAEDGTEEFILFRENGEGGGDSSSSSSNANSAAARRGMDERNGNNDDDDDSVLWDDIEKEMLDPSLLAPERVRVTQDDVNHVRYILGLGLRRLRRFAEAEAINMDVLRSDVRNVDAVESLLELYTGLDDGDKIQQLFAFLEAEFESAAKEGRLSRVESAEEAARAVAASTAPTAMATAADAAGPVKGKEGELPEELPPGEVVLPDGQTVLAEGTQPLTTPLEIAMSLLADMIVEGATRHCAEHGEGSTARFFLQSLSPIGKSLSKRNMTLLIEALFRSLDEQHYVARFELGAEALARDDNLIYSVVISFLKMLLVTRIPTMVEDPVRFRFMVLSKLHSALRSCGRKGESYRFCEDMMTLYRANSSVYARRQQEMERRAKTGHPLGFETEEAIPSGKGPDGTVEAAPAASETEKASEEGVTAPMPLDDMDDAYRNSLFQYLNDRAVDSTVVGRELCLAVMEEFPTAAAPWETLALILHREDPKRNLRDAILAARRGLQLEPFNLSLILTCANLYKADHRYALYELILDRYRLLCYMLENAASDADLRAVADEILEAEKEISEKAEDVKQEEERFQQEKLRDQPKLLRSIEEWARIHSETRSPRTFTHQQPVSAPSLELNISDDRPLEMSKEFRHTNDAFGRRGGGSDA